MHVFGPLLFSLYTALRYHIINSLTFYISFRRSECSEITAISERVDGVSRWFLENGLRLNPAKTEAVLLGNRAQCETLVVTNDKRH